MDKKKKDIKKNLKSKHKKAFTLIELLAVIIVLGIILLVAIPSVTQYINDTRKKAYIDTAKQYVKGATNLVNNGSLDTFDTDTTYYIPISCIKLETGGESPYGKFNPAYVVVTYDNDSFDYYWTSTDETLMGIDTITLSKDLHIDNIKSGIKRASISTDRTIDGRSNIVVFDESCSNADAKEATVFSLVSKACTYEGELVQGAEYVDGQYTYRYMQEGTGTNAWGNINNDGWGVVLTDKNSTDPVTTPLCSSINDKPIVSMSYMFYYSKAPSIDASSFNTSSVTNMRYMFYNATSLTSLDLRSFNTKNLNNVYNMFGYTNNLETIRSSKNFTTSNLTDMSYMFYYASKLKSVDFIKNADTSKVTNLQYTFYYNRTLTDLEAVKNWDISKVTNLYGTFYNCSGLTNIEGIRNWNTSNVKNIDYLLYNDYNIASLDPLANWDVKKVTSAKYPFYFVNVPNIEALRNWEMDSATNLDYFLYYLKGTSDLSPIIGWDMSRITSLSHTFAGMSGLTNLNSLRNLDVSHVKSFYGLFRYNSNLTDISGINSWNMTNVETMDYMFSSNSKMTNYSSVKQWNIPKVKSMKYMFSSNSSLTNLSSFNNWNLANVESIKGMFSSCTQLTDLTGITTWTYDKLTDMSALFMECTKLTNLNGIRNINFRNVTNISRMFFKCTSLENISPVQNWDVTNITNMGGLFGCEYISNPSTVRNWNVVNVVHPNNQVVYNSNDEPAGFYLIFKTTRRYYLTPFTFVKRTGCWANDGTYVPNGTGCGSNDNYRCGGGCLDGDTLVAVYDEKKKKKMLKKIKDLTYHDLILVWNFDKGKYEWVKPLWIMAAKKYHESVILKFDDGTVLKVIGDHKIYNDDAKMFTSARFEEETPIGTHTINSEGKVLTLVSREIVRGTVYAYNVITDKHINLYANGILTSRGSNNLYPIDNMKFIKEERESFTREELKDIPDEYFYGLRLNERRIDYNGSKEETIEDIRRLVNELIKEKIN